MAEDDDSVRATARWSARNADRLHRDQTEPDATQEPQQTSGTEPRKVRQTLFKGWRPVALLLIAAMTSGIGFHFKSLADPGVESKTFARQPPLVIDVFLTNPAIPVRVIADIESGTFIRNIQVQVQASRPYKNGSILILSSISPSAEGFVLLSPPPLNRLLPEEKSGQRPIDGYYAAVFPVCPPCGRGVIQKIGLGSFRPDMFESTNASLYGHLPSIGTIDTTYPANVQRIYPAVLGEEPTPPPGSSFQATYLRDIVINPEFHPHPSMSQNLQPSQLSAYITPYHGKGQLFLRRLTSR